MEECHKLLCDDVPKAINREGNKKCRCNCSINKSSQTVEQTEGEQEGCSPYPSQQGFSKTCSSHALGKAIVKIMDAGGFDVEQGDIIKTLQARVSSPANTSAFDQMEVKIYATEKETEMERDIVIKIVVEEITEDDLVMVQNDMTALIICWEILNMWTGEENPHAIYVEKYDAASKVFYCINSWGRFIKSKPKVHISAVSRIYSISLELE